MDKTVEQTIDWLEARMLKLEKFDEKIDKLIELEQKKTKLFQDMFDILVGRKIADWYD